MRHGIIVKTALKRREVFRDLEKHLGTIKEIVRKLDPKAEIYLFGSVAENRHTYSSDIDVLIVTKTEPGTVHFELWKSGIKEPFEIHIEPPERAHIYKRVASVIRV